MYKFRVRFEKIKKSFLLACVICAFGGGGVGIEGGVVLEGLWDAGLGRCGVFVLHCEVERFCELVCCCVLVGVLWVGSHLMLLWTAGIVFNSGALCGEA